MSSSPNSNVAKSSTVQSLSFTKSNKSLKKKVAPSLPTSNSVSDSHIPMPTNASNPAKVQVPTEQLLTTAAEQPPIASNIPIGAQLGFMTATGFQPLSGNLNPSLPQPVDQGALQLQQIVPSKNFMHNFLFPAQPFSNAANSANNDSEVVKLLKGLLMFQYFSK